jgi:hypothetical protein
MYPTQAKNRLEWATVNAVHIQDQNRSGFWGYFCAPYKG